MIDGHSKKSLLAMHDVWNTFWAYDLYKLSIVTLGAFGPDPAARFLGDGCVLNVHFVK